MAYKAPSNLQQKNTFGVFQSNDPGVALTAIFGSKTLLGATLLASAVLPRSLSAVAGLLVLISAYRNAVSFTFSSYFFPKKPKPLTLSEKRTVNLDTNSTEPIGFRVAPVIKGDFCVFLIGFRMNAFTAKSKGKWVGDAMQEMLAELQAAPELGCLNVDSYVTPNPVAGSTFLLVQYWRSYEQLVDYSRGKDFKHYPAWMRILKEAKDNGSTAGIWHEAFKVRDGEYEGIYVNTPPMGLGKIELTPAVGRMTTSKGRTGDTDGKDYIDGAEESYNLISNMKVENEQKCPMSGAVGATCPMAQAK